MKIRSFRGISAAFLVLAPALAQAAAQPRTFVSAKKGSDSAQCSRTAPCRTFGRAIAVTTPGGEVVVLDSGGYGSVTIGQAVSLEAPDGIYAGITVSSGDGITVAAGVNDLVVIRGLTLTGTSAAGNGITVTSAGTVHVEHCTIRGFSTGNGVLATQSLFQFLYVEDSEVSECNVGVALANSTATQTVLSAATIERSHFAGSLTAGLFLSASENPVFVTVTDCSIRGGTDGLILGDLMRVELNRCDVSNNSDTDLLASGAGSLVFIMSSMIASERAQFGIRSSSTSEVCSLGNNFILDGPTSQCPLR